MGNFQKIALVMSMLACVNPLRAEEVEKPIGTVCFASNIRNPEQKNFFCKDLGLFASVNDLYKSGYHIVASNVITEAGIQVIVFFVEKK